MFPQNKKLKKKIPRWISLTTGIILFFLLFTVSFHLGYQKTHAGKFYHGIVLAGIDIGGKTYEEVQETLQAKIDEVSRSGFLFSYKDRQVVIMPHISSTADPDISYDLVTFALADSLNQAFNVGRNPDYLTGVKEQIQAFIHKKKFNFVYQLEKEKFLKTLQENFADLENPGTNAHLIITKENEDYLITVTEEKTGQVFDYQTALQELTNNLNNLNNSQIKMALIADMPKIKKSQTTKILEQVKPALAKAPLTLKFERQSWQIDKDALAGLLDFYLSAQEVKLGLDQELFFAYLEQKIVPDINQEIRDAKFALKNNKVVEFQGAQEGKKINKQAVLDKINEEFIAGEMGEIKLIVETTQPNVPTAEVNDLGITEIIGIGISDFSGSPANRRHNIRNAAYNTLNGILIKPDEEFSLVRALGPVNAETGYLPELVIKGNRTIPEYGGGLCQIGTTIFRSAIASGLPITERRPHSYRVVYYEPAGMDATIYIPHPDVRFINDTGNYILIQAKIEGNILKFEFWGTKDGRTMWYTGQQESDYLYDITPKIWDFTYPPPTKYIESIDIPVGSKKCTESSHVGATTEFGYKIIYPNNTINEQVFHTVYSPWQAVCLVGVEELSAPEEVEGESENGGSDVENTDLTD